MNLIVCDQSCKYQEEGYCTLNHIATLTNNIESKCGYFESKGINKQDIAAASVSVSQTTNQIKRQRLS